MFQRVALFLFAFALFTAGLSAQQNSVVGVWKVTERTAANGTKNTSPQPGLYIFTPKHYSRMLINSVEPRPKYPARDKATDADIIKTFDAFNANSGSYTLSGNTVSFRPIVAKNEFIMSGPEQKSEFSFSGNALTLTGIQANGSRGEIIKLTRLE